MSLGVELTPLMIVEVWSGLVWLALCRQLGCCLGSAGFPAQPYSCTIEELKTVGGEGSEISQVGFVPGPLEASDSMSQSVEIAANGFHLLASTPGISRS